MLRATSLRDTLVELGEPTLGIVLADGQLAFPAGSLLLRIDAQLTGTPNVLLENGAETFWLRNPTAVVGRLVDGSLDLRMEVSTMFGLVKVDNPRPLMAHGAQLPQPLFPTIIHAYARHCPPHLARVRSLRSCRPR